jgi:hypothetical protein
VVFEGRPLGAASAAADSGAFTLPADTFRHSDPEAGVRLRATQADGSPLPSWLVFEADSGTFRVQAGAPTEAVDVKVIATDRAGRTTTASLTLRPASPDVAAAGAPLPGGR